ncbi:DHA1 family inner membrane transport protein [Tamaricihabitans halophyticus]|uniref:DHA1 family inner membrane transport protein n=1 Tax=Tamaricihabitans halophyticus TaxID=1262583 RepID=A0A4R2QLF7_9PSEU|nr:MFS transporter [Tamaricihabitans halophyticus]TCP49368.1 DHA1 family inner membrane transport protein [Tamaricihabitans halophyticus]
MPVALIALAIGAFGIGTTEFVMMGVLPETADAFGVSIPTAGNLISAYALGVVVGAPTLTVLAARLPRKTMLLAMMAVFTVANLGFAAVPNAELGVALRFLAGLPHGAFFGAGAVVAASLVGKGDRAKAVSMMFVGLTLANVIGVPLGTLLAQQVGWRATFIAVAAIGLLAMLSVYRLIPDQGKPAPGSLREEFAAFRRPQVLLALAIVMFGFGGTFACLSYISPMLTDVTGYSPGSVTLLLALVGVGMTVGNLLGGWLADRALMPSLCIGILSLAALLALFTVTGQHRASAAVTIFCIGIAGFMIGPMMQTRIMDKAGGSASLVSAAVQSAFNIANSIGAYLGGVVIAGGLGLMSPNVVGALLALLGLGLAGLSVLLDVRTSRAQPAAAH